LPSFINFSKVDAAAFGMGEVVVPDPIEMRELAAEPAEIFPDLQQERVDFLG
jgi:hypothetical protein